MWATGRVVQDGSPACVRAPGWGAAALARNWPAPPRLPPAPPLPARQVVSGDEGGTIVLWNLGDGRRAGGFSLHAAPASAAGGAAAAGAGGATPAGVAGERLTAMAFDAAQRRLLTATDAGGLRAYNFNSGWGWLGCGSKAEHHTCVGWAGSSRRMRLQPDATFAPAAAAAMACALHPTPRRAVLREFTEGRRRRASRQHEGGREITAMAFVAAALQPAAEEGGEERGGQQEQQVEQAPLALGAACSTDGYSELSEHALLSMQAQRGSQAHAAVAKASNAGGSTSSEAGGDAPPNLVLATGWSRCLCAWEEGDERTCDACRRLPGHAADVLSLAPLGPHVAATGAACCLGLGGGVGVRQQPDCAVGLSCCPLHSCAEALSAAPSHPTLCRR